MSVELTQEETALLKELLESALGEIKAEVRHTDTSDFRRNLREKEDRIRQLLDRL